MPRWSRVRHGRALVCLIVVYAAVLCASPVLHHDIDCHLKSPTHCPACLANPAASRAESSRDLVTVSFPLAGAIERFRASCPAPPVRVVNAGRAPPA